MSERRCPPSLSIPLIDNPEQRRRLLLCVGSITHDEQDLPRLSTLGIDLRAATCDRQGRRWNDCLISLEDLERLESRLATGTEPFRADFGLSLAGLRVLRRVLRQQRGEDPGLLALTARDWLVRASPEQVHSLMVGLGACLTSLPLPASAVKHEPLSSPAKILRGRLERSEGYLHILEADVGAYVITRDDP